jgi:hypothetical protein
MLVGFCNQLHRRKPSPHFRYQPPAYSLTAHLRSDRKMQNAQLASDWQYDANDPQNAAFAQKN